MAARNALRSRRETVPDQAPAPSVPRARYGPRPAPPNSRRGRENDRWVPDRSDEIAARGRLARTRTDLAGPAASRRADCPRAARRPRNSPVAPRRAPRGGLRRRAETAWVATTSIPNRVRRRSAGPRTETRRAHPRSGAVRATASRNTIARPDAVRVQRRTRARPAPGPAACASATPAAIATRDAENARPASRTARSHRA